VCVCVCVCVLSVRVLYVYIYVCVCVRSHIGALLKLRFRLVTTLTQVRLQYKNKQNSTYNDHMNEQASSLQCCVQLVEAILASITHMKPSCTVLGIVVEVSTLVKVFGVLLTAILTQLIRGFFSSGI